MELVHLYDSVDLALDRQGYYNLSFFGGDGLDWDEICRRNPMKTRRVRCSTAAAMRRAGFDPRPQGRQDHLEVRFGVRPTDSELERLVEAFGDAIPNPHPAE